MIHLYNIENFIEEINPIMFCIYLRETRWNEYKTKREFIKVFQIYKDHEAFQSIIPLKRDLLDYEDAMYRAIETVASVEECSIEMLICVLLNSNAHFNMTV